MPCDDFRVLLHGDLDDELETTEAARLSAHLAVCAACRRIRARQEVLRAAVKMHAAGQFSMPARLPIRILAALPTERPAPERFRLPSGWFKFSAALAVAVMVAVGLTYFLLSPDPNEQLADEAIATHSRSLLANHLTDVASSDPATVREWFRGKLNYVPPVKDVSARGFSLVGGRLEYLYDRELAAVIYRRGPAVINLFIWPAETAPKAVPRQLLNEGFSIVLWAEAGINYCSIAKLNEKELAEFVQAYRAQPG